MKTKLTLGALGILLIGMSIGWGIHYILYQRMLNDVSTEAYMLNDKITTAQKQGTMDAITMDLKDKTGDVFDQEFLTEMITHHQGAVEMAKMVLTNTKRPELITLAKNIISAQTKEIQQMKSWQDSWFGQ